jgi:glycosyltransferase XagB
MQTLLVHTRAPRRLLEETGWRGGLTMASMLGGTVWSALVNPLLWAVFLASCLGRKLAAEPLDILALVSGLSLLAANILLAALSLTGRSGFCRLGDLFHALSFPVYWLLLSAAAYRALWQLLRDPFRWEKTPHGAA